MSRLRSTVRILAVGALLLAALQCALWFFVGRSSFESLLADAIRAKADGRPLVLDPHYFIEPDESAQRVLRLLAETHQVWEKADVSPQYYSVIEIDEGGEEVRSYRGGLAVGLELETTPWSGTFGFGGAWAPMGASGFDQEWYFILGFWVPKTEPQLWIS